MRRLIHVSIRHKILIALLLVVTAVVSAITFTMANLFHADKKVYVSDLASVVALNTAEKADALITGYGERLLLCARIYEDPTLSTTRKSELLADLMRGFRGCVELSFWTGSQRATSYYDNAALEAARISKETVERYGTTHPLPLDRLAAGHLVVENATFSKDLPAIRVAVPGLLIPGQPPHLACALLRIDDLQRMSHESQAFEVSLVDRSGTLVSHRDPHLLQARKKIGTIPTLSSPSAAMVSEYSRNGVDWIGGYARVESADLVVAAEIPKSAAFFASRELLRHLVIVALALLMMSALVGMIWSRSLTGSIGRLAQATRVIAKGDFDVKVKVKAGDEIGTLAESFNQMAFELHGREKALKDAHAQLIQSEKMAAFGQLGAGFAHEIKNPLAGIQGLAQLLQLDVDKDSNIHQGLVTVEKETKRCRAIIDNLMKFARQEKMAFAPVEAATVIGDAAAIMEHQLGIHTVVLEKSVENDLPPFLGNANQLQQVLMNLILNAQQAFDGRPGKVRVVAARGPGQTIELRVEDEGPGIPKHIQARLFEPFFTTKPPGKGTGLGLSVSYGIVLEHKGTISVESEPGQGTKFIIRIPEAPADAAVPAELPSNPNINPTHLPHPHDGVKFKRSEPAAGPIRVARGDGFGMPAVAERMPVDETFDHLKMPDEASSTIHEPPAAAAMPVESSLDVVMATEPDAATLELEPASVESPRVEPAPLDENPVVLEEHAPPPVEPVAGNQAFGLSTLLESAAAGLEQIEREQLGQDATAPAVPDPHAGTPGYRDAWSSQLAWSLPMAYDASLHDESVASPPPMEPIEADYYADEPADFTEEYVPSAPPPEPQPFHLMPEVQEFQPVEVSPAVSPAEPAEVEWFGSAVEERPDANGGAGVDAPPLPDPAPVTFTAFKPYGLLNPHPEAVSSVDEAPSVEETAEAGIDREIREQEELPVPVAQPFTVAVLGQPFGSGDVTDQAEEHRVEAEIEPYENESLVEIDPRAAAFASLEAWEQELSLRIPVAFELRDALDARAVDPRVAALAQHVEGWRQQLSLTIAASFDAVAPVETVAPEPELEVAEIAAPVEAIALEPEPEVAEIVSPIETVAPEPEPEVAEITAPEPDPRAVALADRAAWKQQLASSPPEGFRSEERDESADVTEPGELERLLVDRTVRAAHDPAEKRRQEALASLVEKVGRDPDIRDYAEVRNGFRRVEAGAAAQDITGDIALLYGYIRMLDPRAPIGEGEGASAERVPGVPETVRRLYNQAVNGRELSPAQRAHFIATCRRLHDQRKANYERAVEFFKRQADGYEIDSRKIIPTLGPPETGKTKPVLRPWMKPKKRAA